jgi:hypothetical protein
MTSVLTNGWFSRLVERGRSLPELPGASARVSFGPSERRSSIEPHHVVIVDGRVDAAGTGLLEDGELTVLLSSDDVEALWRGQVDLPVAFMQGRAKVVGSTGVLLGLLPLLRSPAWSELLASCVDGG